MNVSDWPHIFTAGASTGPLLLMLHGTGSDEHQIAALAASIDPTATVLSPRGQVIENGANRWFRRLSEGVFDVADVTTRADDLAGFVTSATDHYALAGWPLIAVGFSNGANIALALAIRHPNLLSHVVAFSGMYPFGDQHLETDLTGSQFTLLNGENDAMAPRPSVETLAAELGARGADVQVNWRPGGHGITADDLQNARQRMATWKLG